jgi:hypothetical protein
MTDNPWTTLCSFARYPYPADDREPWDVVTTPRPKTKTRKRRMTLARALRQADKAGVSVSNAVIKPDGVELQLGETVETGNEWDTVQ